MAATDPGRAARLIADAERLAQSIPDPSGKASALAAVAEGWQGMWDLARPQGPGPFEQQAATALAAWRAGQFELPDYYLVTAAETDDPGPPDQAEQNFYLGPLRPARSHRVAFIPAT